MIFNSFEFILFYLPLVLVVFYAAQKVNLLMAQCWLAAASLWLYFSWSPTWFWVLLVSIALNYGVAIGISTRALGAQMFLLCLGVAFNLGLLGYFKYAAFFQDAIRCLGHAEAGCFQRSAPVAEIPLGISFYTFSQIAYLLDLYKRQTDDKGFLRYLLFVTFFPHLIAGPLLRHDGFMRQLRADHASGFRLGQLSLGLLIFILGLAKKTLVADPLAPYAAVLFDAAAVGVAPKLLLAWSGSLAYTFQLYFDFSGYTDMACGLSLLFGLRLPINFNAPFQARSLIDFWQRWHMSLTAFIGRYVHLPVTMWLGRLLGPGSALSEFMVLVLLPTLPIFVLLGVWHGANWTFVAFGLYHGVGLVVNHAWRRLAKPLARGAAGWTATARGAAAWLLTFVFVTVGFVIFRADSLASAGLIFEGMLGRHGVSVPPVLASFGVFGHLEAAGIWQGMQNLTPGFTLRFLLITALAAFIAFFVADVSKLNQRNDVAELGLVKARPGLSGVAVALLLAASLMSLGENSPFLYFAF